MVNELCILLTFYCMSVPQKFFIRGCILYVLHGQLQIKSGHCSPKHQNMLALVVVSHHLLSPMPLFCWSFESHSQARVIGPKKDSLSQQWGHDPSVNSFVDGEVLYWRGFRAVSPQRAINSPQLTLNRPRTAMGKHSYLWRNTIWGQLHP